MSSTPPPGTMEVLRGELDVALAEVSDAHVKHLAARAEAKEQADRKGAAKKRVAELRSQIDSLIEEVVGPSEQPAVSVARRRHG